MPKISADYNRILSAAGEFKAQSKRIDQIRSDIQGIMNKIPLHTTFFTAAKTKMLLQCLIIAGISDKYRGIGSALEEIERTYRNSDVRAGGGLRGGYVPLPDIWGRIIEVTDVISGKWKDFAKDVFSKLTDSAIYRYFTESGIPYTPAGAKAIRDFLLPGFIGIPGIAMPTSVIIGLLASTEVSLGNKEKSGLKLFSSAKGSFDGLFEDYNDKLKEKYKKNGDLKTKSWNSDSKKMGLYDDGVEQKYGKEKLDNLKEANKFMSREAEVEIVGTSAEVSALKAEGHYDGDIGSIDGNIKIGKAEAHAGAGLGVYATKDASGKTHRGVGVYGEVGASVSALEGELTGRLGNENLGVYAKAEGKALSAGATAGVNVGAVDGKVQAYVGGKAEAVLVEGSISGGATVLGTDVGVKATGKVGFSASANAGIKDGHLVLDVGLAVGVGGEVSLDIDLSKPAEVIGNGVKEAGKAIQGAAKGAKEFFGKWFK